MTQTRVTAPAHQHDVREVPGEHAGRAVQTSIYRAGALGRTPPLPVLPEALEAAAQRRMSRRSWAYVAGSAGQQRTARANREAFERRRLVPRMLRGAARPDTSLELFGEHLPAPVLLAPIGVLEQADRGGDLAVARSSARTGVPMVISTQGSHPMEATAQALGEAPRWFQLYWSKDRDLITSFVRRAEAIGSTAIVVTLDTTMLGWRPLDLQLGSLPFTRGMGIAQYTSDPVFTELVRARAAAGGSGVLRDGPLPGPGALTTLVSTARRYPGPLLENLRSPLPRAAVETFLDVFADPALRWGDLAFLRALTDLPILVKGVQDRGDAALALEHGVDGIVVSNHGGRQVDGATAALDALPGVVAEVAGRVPVLFDSGVRGAADVMVALALGARAVLLGRPYVYGLALAAERGVTAVVEHLLGELSIAMTLSGCADLGDLTPDLLTEG